MANVIITPASGNIEFQYGSGTTTVGNIRLTDANTLVITATAGVQYGNSTSNITIGDGTSSIDIIYPQSGAIRALTGKTLTVGQSDSTVSLVGTTIGVTGNVGIGNSTPVTKIDINGNAAQNIVAVAASAVDCSTGNIFTKTASGGLTWTFTNVPASRSFIFALYLTNGGTGTQSWPAAVVWDGGTAPTLQASGTDILIFSTVDGGTTWRGVRGWKQA